MKPRYLEFCGINSFSERAEIDFVSLLEFGLFGIFGDTGSGKSTILDCIGFALYGNVARSRSGSMADVINYQSEKAYVNFEFEIYYEGLRKIYRVEREIKRKNAVQSLKIYEKKENTLTALAEGVREGNALLERIIGLEQKDFEKCIALPQGEFAQFVKSQRSERLKLVSRLFNLEAYGERLVKKTNTKYAECLKEYDLVQARLEQFAEITGEGIAALEAEVETRKEQEKMQKEALNSVRTQEKKLSELLKTRLESERTAKRLEVLEEDKPHFAELERELGRLELASAVVKVAAEAENAQKEAQKAQENLNAALLSREKSDKAVALLSAWDEEKADEEIARLTELRARAEQAAQSEKKRLETERALKRMRAEYVEEAGRFSDFDYETERGAIEERIHTLGEGDLFSFAEQEGKASLLRAEYAVFCSELNTVYRKYPETAEEIVPLIEKYTALSCGDKTSFSQIRSDYEAREQRRKAEQAKLLELEKKHGLYREHLQRLQQLQTDGVRLKGELTELENMRAQSQGMSLAEAEQRLSACMKEKRDKTEERNRALKEQTAAIACCAAAEEKQKAAHSAESSAVVRLNESFASGKFENADEAKVLIAKYGNADEVRSRVTQFNEEYMSLTLRRKELEKINFSEATEEKVACLQQEIVLREEEYNETVRLFALKSAELERSRTSLEKKLILEKESAKAKKQAQLYERLKKLFEGNKFMDFVAEEYLQNVAQNASGRLLSLTDGRYFLRYEGGAAGFCVGDNFNGGKTRGVYTLSGGETFLVSLSLALALSAEICAKSLRPIEFFFLDEGFGTLDEKLVGTVMDSLDKLKGEHFAIGIISHVEELKHRIERKLSVEKATEKHGSKIYAE